MDDTFAVIERLEEVRSNVAFANAKRRVQTPAALLPRAFLLRSWVKQRERSPPLNNCYLPRPGSIGLQTDFV